MDGVIGPLLARIEKLEAQMRFVMASAPPGAMEKAAEQEAADAPPATTLSSMRIPAQPGMPIPNYDADTQGFDDATEDAMAAEAEANKVRGRRRHTVSVAKDENSAPLPPSKFPPMPPVTPARSA